MLYGIGYVKKLCCLLLVHFSYYVSSFEYVMKLGNLFLINVSACVFCQVLIDGYGLARLW